MKKVIGVTGRTGSGKSALCHFLEEKGAIVLDADHLAKALQSPGEPGLAAIRSAFGREILMENGSLNRALLAHKIFTSASDRKKLNKAMLPLIRQELIAHIERMEEGIIILDAPLLMEAEMEDYCDSIIEVRASEEVRLKRIMARHNLTENEARIRLSGGGDAVSIASKRRRGQTYRALPEVWVLWNDGDLDSLKNAALGIWGEIIK